VITRKETLGQRFESARRLFVLLQIPQKGKALRVRIGGSHMLS
jgi:hypothetical protein